MPSVTKPVVGVIGNAHVVNDRHNVQLVGQRNMRAIAEVAGVHPFPKLGNLNRRVLAVPEGHGRGHDCKSKANTALCDHVDAAEVCLSLLVEYYSYTLMLVNTRSFSSTTIQAISPFSPLVKSSNLNRKYTIIG